MKKRLLIISLVVLLFLLSIALVGCSKNVTGCETLVYTESPQSTNNAGLDTQVRIDNELSGYTGEIWDNAYPIESGNIFAIVKDDKFGFIDRNGNIISKVKWDSLLPFSESTLAMEKDGLWGIIGTTGEIYVQPQWNILVNVNSKINAVSYESNEGLYGLIDKTGNMISEYQWDSVKGIYRDDLIAVERDGKWGLVDSYGEIVSEPQWSHEFITFTDDVDGIIIVAKGNKRGLLDKSGRLITDAIWDDVSTYSEGLALVKDNDKYGFIDYIGNVIIQPKWEEAKSFVDGLAAIKQDGKWGFINKSGNIAIEPQWDSQGSDAWISFNNRWGWSFTNAPILNEFDNGVALVKRNNKYGYINKEGELISAIQWDNATPFFRNMGNIMLNDKWGFINKEGTVVSEPQWDEVSVFNQRGFAAVKNGDMYGMIDETGKIILEPEWSAVYANDSVIVGLRSGGIYVHDRDGNLISQSQWDATQSLYISSDIILIKQNDLWGVADTEGKVVIEPQWDEQDDAITSIYPYSGASNYLSVYKDGKYGCIDKTGRIIIPPVFDENIGYYHGFFHMMRDSIASYIDDNGKIIVSYKWD